MSRASRTAEILAAAGLVPLQLEQERIRAGRDAARSTALASLLPALIQTGAGIAGDVAQRDMAERKFAADIEARKARDADIIKARNARTGVEATKAATEATKAAAEMARTNAKLEADRVKAALEARTTNIAGAASDTESLISRPGGVSQAELERVAVARGLPASDWRTVLGARDTAVDTTAAAAAKARQGEAEARLAERRAAAPMGKATPKEPKVTKPALTPAEVESVLELQGARDMLGRLEQMKQSGGTDGAEIDTGPLAALKSFFASKAGVADPRMVKFKALAGEQIAGYIKSISGATVSESERRSLLENIPSTSDDDEEFMAKLQSVKDTLDAKLRLKSKAYAATGRDASIFGDTGQPSAVSPTVGAKPISEMTDEELAAYKAVVKGRKQ
jgi:hypothetical protein